MRDSDVGKVRVDGLYNLIIIRSYTLKLEIKVVQMGDELCLRGITFNDYELLAEDFFDDKPAAIMFQSCLTKQLIETNILPFIEPERILVTRCSGLPIGYVCQFSVGIHNIGSKGVRLGRTPGLAERAFLSDKPQFVGQKHSSLPSGDGKNTRRRIAAESFGSPP